MDVIIHILPVSGKNFEGRRLILFKKVAVAKGVSLGVIKDRLRQTKPTSVTESHFETANEQLPSAQRASRPLAKKRNAPG